MRVILVPVADRPECIVALDAAFELAQRLDSNVVGCHVRPHRLESAPQLGQLMPDGVYDWLSQSGESAVMNSEAAEALFLARSEHHGFQSVKRPRAGKSRLALWKEMVGTPARVFSVVGPVADLAVLSRPKPQGKGPAKAFLLAASLHTGRPILVLPQRGKTPVGKRILVAWNQSIEAATAVSAALPMLQRAERVVLVRCGADNRTGPKASHLAEYLLHWGVKAERVATKGRDIEQDIDRTYREVGADVLLMGAYSRHRLRELIFGGVTETMLFESNLPVLMLHR